MFNDAERVFNDVECVFNDAECMFNDVEHNFSLGLSMIASRSIDNFP